MTRTPEEIAAELARIARSVCEPEVDEDDLDDNGNPSSAHTASVLRSRFLPIITEVIEAERKCDAELRRVLDLYLQEYETPVPDHLLRSNLRKQLVALCRKDQSHG